MVEPESNPVEPSPFKHEMLTLVGNRVEVCAGVHALTPRQREIMELVVAGHPSKNIATDLRISQRTVENHRASIMRKTGSTSIPALVRLPISAAVDGDVATQPRDVRVLSA